MQVHPFTSKCQVNIDLELQLTMPITCLLFIPHPFINRDVGLLYNLPRKGAFKSHCVRLRSRIQYIHCNTSIHTTYANVRSEKAPQQYLLYIVYDNQFESNTDWSVLGDRSKLPAKPKHFRTWLVRSNQTPLTLRPFAERILLLTDWPLRTDNNFWTHP
jgi:hypothetical protein